MGVMSVMSVLSVLSVLSDGGWVMSLFFVFFSFLLF